jgi:hypothetical protein
MLFFRGIIVILYKRINVLFPASFVKYNKTIYRAEMILHSDRYFEHLYDVKLDMVSVKWPTIESIYLPEILNSVSILVQNVINYNIRNMLVDASETKLLADYNDADKVVNMFVDGLAKSRLEKLARIESVNLDREIMLKLLASELNSKYNYETRFFNDYSSAFKWLEQGNKRIGNSILL